MEIAIIGAVSDGSSNRRLRSSSYVDSPAHGRMKEIRRLDEKGDERGCLILEAGGTVLPGVQWLRLDEGSWYFRKERGDSCKLLTRGSFLPRSSTGEHYAVLGLLGKQATQYTGSTSYLD